LRNKLWERKKFKTYLSGDIENYGSERDVSLSRGRGSYIKKYGHML
jgi:hypothetical protein